jgi:hypothetical protein
MKVLVPHVGWCLPGVTLAVILTMGTMHGNAQEAKAQAVMATSRELVWPLPPDKPRIRFLETFSNNFDVEPRKKRSWADRLIGRADQNVTEYFDRPAGIAIDSRGRLLIASMQRATVFILDKEKRLVIRLRGDRGVFFRNPLGLAVDSQDNFYVSDPMLKMVMKFDPEGHLVSTIGQEPNQQFMRRPGHRAEDGRADPWVGPVAARQAGQRIDGPRILYLAQRVGDLHPHAGVLVIRQGHNRGEYRRIAIESRFGEVHGMFAKRRVRIAKRKPEIVGLDRMQPLQRPERAEPGLRHEALMQEGMQ